MKVGRIVRPVAYRAAAVALGLTAVAGIAMTPAKAEDGALSAPAVEGMIEQKIDQRIEQFRAETLDTKTIGPIVRQYLLENPGVLEEVLVALEAKREQDEATARSEALASNSDEIFRSEHSPVAGNPDGDVTLVEFFDYNCGYCKRMLPALIDLMQSDPNLRVVFKEWPILTEGSAGAARIAHGIQMVAPERYLDFHLELMAQPGGGGGIDKERALAVAESLGIDRKAVEKASRKPEVDEAISENFRVAEALGLRGTPAFVVGEEVIPGAVSFEALQERIAEAREKECLTC